MKTRSYTDFTQSASKQIPYEFICEHCQKSSGILIANISGTAMTRKSGSGRNLTKAESAEMEARARKDLEKNLLTAKEDVTQKQFFNPRIFSYKCPHCDKAQSWGARGQKEYLKKGIKDDLFISLLFSVPIGVVIAAFGSLELAACLKGLQIGGLIFCGFFLYFTAHSVKESKRITQECNHSNEKRLPTVYWI